jgi:hypothetical protein
MRKLARNFAIGVLMAGVAAGGVAAPAAADDYRDNNRRERTSYWQDRYDADKCVKRYYDYSTRYVVLRDRDHDRDYQVLVLKGRRDFRVQEYPHPQEYYRYHLDNYRNIRWSISCWNENEYEYNSAS